MEKEFLYKKVPAVLCAAAVVVSAATASHFSYGYEQSKAQVEALSTSLKEAQEQLAELEEEVAQYKEQEEVLEAMAEEKAAQEELLEIPFEVNLEDWNYLLVNALNPLAQEFEVDLVKTYNSHSVDARIKDALEDMIDAGNAEGLQLMICSSYRDYKKQDTLLANSIKKNMRNGLSYKDAYFKARERIALTGTSEHHTGLALDIVGKGHQSLDTAQANTKEAKWLKEHCQEYGFILRYPADKEELTMIKSESWHFRYVGVEAATFMMENNLCLEEFVELVKAHEERDAAQKALHDQARK